VPKIYGENTKKMREKSENGKTRNKNNEQVVAKIEYY
jgi:hypothetical protein